MTTLYYMAAVLFLVLLAGTRSAAVTNGNIEFGFYPARIPTPQEPDPVRAGWEKLEEGGTLHGRVGDGSAGEKLRKGATQRERLIDMLFMNYKTHERPTEGLDAATIVKVNLQIQAIFSIEVQTMDYYMDTLLRQTWTDPRLRWDHLPEFKNFTQPLVSPMLKSQLWLPDLYGYTLDELKFVWRETLPVELPKKMEVPEFNTPTNFSLFDCSAGASTSTGNYSCLLARFMLKRQ
ncbi:unnamed protein product, partial [Dibothriocephalus latus]